MTVAASIPAVVRLLVLFTLAVSAALPVHAQTRTVQDQRDLINWYYAATFGTGVYSAGDRKVAVVQLPISRALVPVSEDRYGLTLKVPVTFGFYDYSFDEVLVGDLPNQLSTLSVMAGLEWELPLTRRWTLRPYFSGGFGQELSGVDSALIYDFGLKSRFLIAEDKGVEFSMVNSLTVAGYHPRNAPNQPFGVFAIGLDIMIPTNRVLFGRDALIGFTPIYYYYFNELKFAKITDPDNRIGSEFELALSVMSRKPWSLKYFDVDRVGIAFRTSNEVFGVSLITSLPF